MAFIHFLFSIKTKRRKILSSIFTWPSDIYPPIKRPGIIFFNSKKIEKEGVISIKDLKFSVNEIPKELISKLDGSLCMEGLENFYRIYMSSNMFLSKKMTKNSSSCRNTKEILPFIKCLRFPVKKMLEDFLEIDVALFMKEQDFRLVSRYFSVYENDQEFTFPFATQIKATNLQTFSDFSWMKYQFYKYMALFS